MPGKRELSTVTIKNYFPINRASGRAQLFLTLHKQKEKLPTEKKRLV